MDMDLTILAASASLAALMGSILPLIRDWFASRARYPLVVSLIEQGKLSSNTSNRALIVNVGVETFQIDVNDIDSLDTAQLQKALVSVKEAQIAQDRSAA